MNRYTSALACALSMVVLAAPGLSRADYPDQPVKLVVGYAPGGSVDTFARLISKDLGQELGQTVLIENVPGAGGAIGVNRVVQAKPDGYTILMGIVSDVVLVPLTQASARYTYRDLAAVAPLGTSGAAIVANPALGIHSFADLIARAKAEPGKLSYGATGVGSLPAIAMETFKRKTNSDIVFIPYASASKLATDVIGGTLDIGVSGAPALQEFIKSGRVSAVGVMSRDRDIGLPDVASAGETPVLAGMDYYFWTGIFAPAGTPQPIVDKVNAAFTRVMAKPDIQARFKDLGVKVSDPATPKAFAEYVATSHAQWEKDVKAASIVKQ